MDRKLRAAQEWLRLRKKTVLAHWLYGLFCAIVAWLFFPAGIIFLGIFAWWERWNDQNEKERNPIYKAEGDMDFWDALVVAIPSFVIILVLDIAGKLSIGWY